MGRLDAGDANLGSGAESVHGLAEGAGERERLVRTATAQGISRAVTLGKGQLHARVEPKGNANVITMEASGTAKIETLMAAFNAIAWMAANLASSQTSIFVI